MAEKKNPLGPTGARVQTNVAQLRKERRMTYKELSDRLESIGRGIAVLGLSRIEQGERRVDADDLVALAVALNVSPARLLLPGGDDESEEIALTPGVTVSADEAWSWMRGDEPISAGHPDMATLTEIINDFERHSLPAFEQRRIHRGHTAVSAATDVLDRIRAVLDEREDRQRAASLRRALKRLAAEIDDLTGDDDDGRR